MPAMSGSPPSATLPASAARRCFDSSRRAAFCCCFSCFARSRARLFCVGLDFCTEPLYLPFTLPARLAARSAASAAAGPTAATAAARLGPRFVHGNLPAVQIGLVQRLDRRLSGFLRLHLDERESSRPAGHLIAHDVDRVDRSDRREDLLEPVLVRTERKVADEQFTPHLSHSLP